MALQEAKLKAKGLNPDGTPALSTLGGFSPASKPCKLVLWTETWVVLFETSSTHGVWLCLKKKSRFALCELLDS